MYVRYTTESFKELLKNLYGDLFCTRDVVYVSSTKPVDLHCPKHGKFSRLPNNLQRGKVKCMDCVLEGKLSRIRAESLVKFKTELNKTSPFITFNEKEFKGLQKHLTVHCTKHGRSYSTTPTVLMQGHGCPACKSERLSSALLRTKDEFVEEAVKIKGDSYNYSKVDYKHNLKHVLIGCNTCGQDFLQTPHRHFSGGRCSHCYPFGFDTSKPAHLYILKSENLTKIGITNRAVNTRLTKLNQDREDKFNVVTSFYEVSGQLISDVETKALREFRELYAQPTDKFDGYTECFLTQNYISIVARIEQLIKECKDTQQQSFNQPTKEKEYTND